ncbi:hypothetical protein AVEN_32518-1 [Araneus ventricosus]|uniref:Uncharacterized protein n=1 Tax=Araneus ventricosus TaxID=182803 RepID=A0A4Y2G9R7_ARAVE|nr:hypothetical protein AVEN_32518-1 [Araneus ventricosus]
MNAKEEISIQNCFNIPNELPKRVIEMKLQCTISPHLFQCDHPSRAPNFASCTQHSRRPKVTCHQEWSAQYVICRQRRDPHQDRPQASNNPTGKRRMWLDPRRMVMENVVNRK